MKILPITLLSLQLSCCGPAFEALAPTATPNPLIMAGVPLCSRNLTPSQLAKVKTAIAAWNESFPPLGLTIIQNCPDELPGVEIAELDPSKCGYTTPLGITFASDDCLTQCVANHEVGHWAGLIRHAPAEEPGPMSDGDRGDCLPSVQDVAILTRTYGGRASP